MGSITVLFVVLFFSISISIASPWSNRQLWPIDNPELDFRPQSSIKDKSPIPFLNKVQFEENILTEDGYSEKQKLLKLLKLLQEDKSNQEMLKKPLFSGEIRVKRALPSKKPLFTKDSPLAKLDIDQYLRNKGAVKLQIKCLLENGPCDAVGKELKKLLPTIILDNCKFCTPQQKIKLSQVVVHLQQKYPAVWRDSLIKFGQAPKFITAGHANPSIVLFGKKSNYNPEKYQNYNPVLPMPLAADADGEEMAVIKSPSESDQMVQSIIMMPTTLSASAAPELVRSVESPTPPTDPTTSPDGGYFSITSSTEPPSTSVVESTIEVKPTTIEPEDDKTE